MRIMLSVRRVFAYICTLGILLFILDFTGVHRHVFEKDYEKEFSYPLDIPDFKQVVEQYRHHRTASFEPINNLPLHLKLLAKANKDCTDGPYRLIILVKSPITNFKQREAIRITWGHANRFSDVRIKTVFLIGSEPEMSYARDGKMESVDLNYAKEIQEEVTQYNDIVHGDFQETEDSSSNTTVKTLMGMKWLVEACSDYRFALFINDGMYLSVKNLLKFIRHPAEYPMYWEQQKVRDELRIRNEISESNTKRIPRAIAVAWDNVKHQLLNDIASDQDYDHGLKKGKRIKSPPVMKRPSGISTITNKVVNVWKNNPVDFDIDLSERVKLYTGNVMSGPTHRHKFGTKYYLSMTEYPYDQMPPFVTTEGILLSKPALEDLYYGSLFTKYLRLDDVFLGIVAKKMDIEPYQSAHFKIDHPLVHDPFGTTTSKDFKYVIATNNFDDPEDLAKFWSLQKSQGNA